MYWLFLALWLKPASTSPYKELHTNFSSSHVQEALRPWEQAQVPVLDPNGLGTIWIIHAPWLRRGILGFTIIDHQDCIVLVKYKPDASTTAHELGHCIGKQHVEQGLMARSGPSGFIALDWE